MSIFWLMFIIMRIIMGVASMIINLFTLVCVITKSYLRSASSLLIASLALCDFLHGVLTSVILPVRYFSTIWHYTHPACLAGICIEVTIVISQLATFTILAFERRNSLFFHLNRSKKWSRKTLMGVLILTWAVIAVYHITVTIYTADIPEGTVCNIVNYYPAFFIYINITIYLTATILILAGYGHIAWIAYKSECQLNQSQSTTLRLNQRRDISITKMMALVVGVFFMLYLPFAVIVATKSPTSPHWHRSLFSVSILIYDINFWINPFIYAWRDKGFKKAFSETFSACRRKCCCCLPLPGGSGTTNTNAQPQVAIIQIGAVGTTVIRLVARDP